MNRQKSTESGQVPATRIKRLLQMMWLMQSATRTSEELSNRFGVSSRTIFRDIQLLRESGVKIESDKFTGYRMPQDLLSTFQLEVEELVALSLADDGPLLANLNGFPNYRAVALSKLHCAAPLQVRKHVEQVLEKVRQLGGDGTLDTHDAAAVNLLLDSWLRIGAQRSPLQRQARPAAAEFAESN